MENPVTLTPVSATEATPAVKDGGIELPQQLKSVKIAQTFPAYRHRWNTNEEIASILLAFSKHADWQQHEVKVRPPSGCLLLFNRNSVRYRKDGYCWQKRKDGRTIREDHLKLKVQGLECIYGSYVHSAILPTFHRRCYWLLQNPDIVLLHYLNVPYPSNTKLSIPVMSISMEKKEWTKEELTQQLRPMFSSTEGESLSILDDSVQTLVQRLMDNQDKLKADQKGDPSSNSLQTKPTTSGPVPIQPDRSLDHCRSNKISHIKTEFVGQTQDSQQPVNFAQGVILNIGQLAKGQQVMLLTGQTSSTQISILTNPVTTATQITAPFDNQAKPSCPTAANSRNTSNNITTFPPVSRDSTVAAFHQPHPGGHILARSASLCDTQNSYSQFVLQRSQSQDGSSAFEGPAKSHLSGPQSQNLVAFPGPGVQTSSEQALFNNNSIISNPSIGNVHPDTLLANEVNSNISNQHLLVSMSDKPIDSNMYGSIYSSCNDNSSSVVNSFLDDLNSELMASERNTPDTENKRGLDHLGDSFESLQASFNTLQGTGINLDQLDMLDLEQMCNELSTGQNDLSSSLDMSVDNQNKSFSVQKDQELVSKCDTITNISDSSRLCHTHTCSLSSSQLTQDFSHSGISGGCSSNLHPDNSSNNATDMNSQVNCTKCGCDPSRLQPNEGQGHRSLVYSGGDNLGHQNHPLKAPTDIACITDFSPDWAYTEGQTKVLVTGPWHANRGTYSVLLDGKVTATTLVQNGVLRCFVPGHKAGEAVLQVSCDGEVISNNAVFQYKEPPSSQTRDTQGHHVLDWFSVEDSKLLDQLITKVEKIESALSKVPDFPGVKEAIASSHYQCEVDGCLSRHLESLSTRLWTNNDIAVENGSMGLSLLHLTAGLGYHRCIQVLIAWRNNNASWVLEYEVDAHCQDLNSCTPLMWACARGHTETASALYVWNKGCLHAFNREGNLPLLVARQHGHHKLADHLEQLDSSGDQSHDLTSSLHRSGSGTNVFGSASFEQTNSLRSVCSNVNTVSNVNSTPNKQFFTPNCPNATSTPITKDNTNLASVKTPHQEDGQVLGALHIDIPSEELDLQQKSHLINKRENPSTSSSEQMVKVVQASSSTCSATGSMSLSATARRQKLRKRFSVDIISNQTLEPVHFSPTTAFQRPVREANSEPHLAANVEHLLDCETNPMLSEGREMSSPEMLVQLEQCERHGNQCNLSDNEGNSQLDNMDTDNLSEGSSSSFIDVERLSSDDEDIRNRILAQGGEIENPQPQMVHLAKQIIAAMPERIKSSPSRGDEIQIEEFQRERSSSYSSIQSSASPHAPSSFGEALSSYGEDSGISTPMHDSLAFDEYRYPDVYSDLGTPASSLSPDSTCLHSPYSPYTFQLDSPPPTAAEFVEYFNAPATFMEKDFSQLTLSDREQRKLYEAAKVIQSAYRQYKDKQCKQQAKEREAAVLIQSYYRRYKQYAYYKKMTQAAVLIQSQFRSYYAQKRFKKSRDAAVVIQNQYRSYKEHERLKKGGNKSVTQRFRSHYQRKPVGPGKGTRVVQIVPDTEGCQEDQSNIAIDDFPPDTTDTNTPEQETRTSRETTPTETQQGE